MIDNRVNRIYFLVYIAGIRLVLNFTTLFVPRIKPWTVLMKSFAILLRSNYLYFLFQPFSSQVNAFLFTMT